MFEGAGDLRAGKGLSFGRLPVNRLHLCAMGMTEDGFYDTVKEHCDEKDSGAL